MHECLRGHAMQAWESLRVHGVNPLPELIRQDARIVNYLDTDSLQALMQVNRHLGDAPQRAVTLAGMIREILNTNT
jgi:adenylosuccinate lyase